MDRPNHQHFQNDCIHAEESYEDYLGGVAPPIFSNSLFTFPDYESSKESFAGKNDRYMYTRESNPTIEPLERKISKLEGTDQSMVLSSGMAAISSAVISQVKSGDHVIVVSNCYSVAYQLFTEFLSEKFGVEVTFVKGSTGEFKDNLQKNTKLFYLESPTSLKFDVQDLESVAKLAGKNDIVTIIDNTYATPYNQRPADYGIDLIVHSASKYINGHSDVVAGIITGRDDLMEEMETREVLGGNIGPFEAWLILRGLRTLGVRMERHNQTGLKIARFLAGHPKVEKVHYPGLKCHAKHELAKKQMSGYGGLMALELDAPEDAIPEFVDSLKVISNAVSWGGFESLILHPYIAVSHSISDKRLSEWGITKKMLRLYVGLEEYEVLRHDLDNALESI